MASPSLLGLPRELRDIIYSYVHTEYLINEWAWRPSRQPSSDWTKGEIHNAPAPSLLLVCSQLQDEYVQAQCFTDLSATLRIDPTGYTTIAWGGSFC
jgi:hypothetical protein